MESVHTTETERQQTVAENLYATIKTNHGEIVVRLLPDFAPKTVANFVGLAEGTREWTHPETNVKSTTPLYDGTVFHRIIPQFMIQGGDPLGQGFGGPGYVFDDEPHPDQTFNDRDYLLAMANAGIRNGKGTNGSQFFITVPTPRRPTHLNGKHTIFGEVVDADSRKVVDEIAAVPTGAQDRPLKPVVIESITIERREG
ncbi:peptidyl-prolyl cis-trans isomerase A (cyclophilin A) [Catenulispora sp. EB89]